MEEKANLIDALLERAADYGKTSYELIKLNVVDKISNLISTFLPYTVVIAFFIIFLMFLNFGVAFWLGDILGHFFYGFFIVAAFYGLIILLLHFFMRKWLKRVIYDYFIRQILK